MIPALVFSLLGIAGCTSEVSAPADLVIERARILDVAVGTLREATVVVRGERVDAIHAGPERNQVPALRRIDAEGAILMPGLIDTHVHLIFLEPLTEAGGDDEIVAGFIRDELPKKLMAYLAHGVTTVKSTGDYYPHILAVREAIAAGELTGPRVFASGPVITAPGGHPAGTLCRSAWCREHVSIQVDSIESAEAGVRRLAADGVDAVKLVHHGFTASNTGIEVPALSREIMTAIVGEAHSLGLRVTAHTWNEAGALVAVLAGVDGLEHGVVEDSITDESLIAAMRDRNVGYAPTLTIWPREANFLELPMANLQRASEAGVRIVLGSDTYYAPWTKPPGGWTVDELEWMVDAGLTTRAALLAGTRDAAEHLGAAERLGTIEPGKYADLLILDGNPLEDLSVLRRPLLVIAGGRVVIDNRQSAGIVR